MENYSTKVRLKPRSGRDSRVLELLGSESGRVSVKEMKELLDEMRVMF